MNTSPKTLGRFQIDPQFSAEQLLTQVDAYCDAVEVALRPTFNDPYEIEPMLRGIGSFEDFREVYDTRLVSETERLLTLKELLVVYCYKSLDLRSKTNLIICKDFVLDFNYEADEYEADVRVNDCIVWPIDEFEDVVLNPTARFAVVRKTLVDRDMFTYQRMEKFLDSYARNPLAWTL